MRTKLYAFIVEYEGGTYISQAEGQTCLQAKANWARAVDVKPMGVRLSSRSRDRFVQGLDDDDAVPVTGMVGVWCFSSILRKHVAIVHVVETLRSRAPKTR